MVDKNGIRIDTEQRSKVISDIVAPRNVKEMPRISGVVGYFRIFIPKFAKHALPLTDFVKKDRLWKWREVEQSALDGIKNNFVKHSFLAYLNFADKFSVHTDSSGGAIGGCIMRQERLVAAT